jgi:hypothetical protein
MYRSALKINAASELEKLGLTACSNFKFLGSVLMPP